MDAILYVCIKDLEIQLQLKNAKVEQLETALQEKEFKRVPLLLGSQKSRRGKTKFNLFYVIYILNNFLCSTVFKGLLPLSIQKIPDC